MQTDWASLNLIQGEGYFNQQIEKRAFFLTEATGNSTVFNLSADDRSDTTNTPHNYTIMVFRKKIIIKGTHALMFRKSDTRIPTIA